MAAKACHMAKRRVGAQYSPSYAAPVRPGAVLPDRVLCLPTFSQLLDLSTKLLYLSLRVCNLGLRSSMRDSLLGTILHQVLRASPCDSLLVCCYGVANVLLMKYYERRLAIVRFSKLVTYSSATFQSLLCWILLGGGSPYSTYLSPVSPFSSDPDPQSISCPTPFHL